MSEDIPRKDQKSDRTLQLVDRFVPMLTESTAQSARLQGSVETLTKTIGETTDDLVVAIRESTEKGSDERQEIREAIKALLKESAAQTESKEKTRRERLKQVGSVALKALALVGAVVAGGGLNESCSARAEKAKASAGLVESSTVTEVQP